MGFDHNFGEDTTGKERLKVRTWRDFCVCAYG